MIKKIKLWWFRLHWERQMKKDKAAGRWPI
jgi:hypothetical protein